MLQNYEYYDGNSILTSLYNTGYLIDAGYKLTEPNSFNPSSMINSLLIDDNLTGNMGGYDVGNFNIPLQYEIEVKGLEQFESVKEKAGEAVEESRDTVSNFSSEMVRQFLELDEEKRAALSVDMSMLPLNMMGIGGAPFQFSLPVEESKEFSETLSNITGIADQLGGFGAGLAKRRLIYLESFSDSYNFNA